MSFLLSLLLFSPLLGLAILFLLPSRNVRLLRLWTLAVCLAPLCIAISLLPRYPVQGSFTITEQAEWIPSIGASYLLGVDGYSTLLIMLTCALTMLAVLVSWQSVTDRVKEYHAYLLLLLTGMLGVFLSLDFLLFFVFWEAVLIPMYFLISIWGGPRRNYAAMKFLLFTVGGSVFLLLGGLLLYFERFRQTGDYSFAWTALTQTRLAPDLQWWIFLGFFCGFAVKVPMWPIHTWLPDAHVEANTAGSVLLAGVLLKMGTYGFLRWSLPLLPDAARDPKVVWWMGLLSLIAILYGALLCLMQKDWKRLVAYSSVSHMGYATLGIFALTPLALQGSMLEQINHGLSTSLLFILAGIAYERRGTREIAEYGGLYRIMPWFTVVLAVAAFSSMGLPGLNGFIGELAILRGALEMSPWWTLGGGIGLILSAAYLLWLLQRVTLGDVSERNLALPDLTRREWVICVPLLAGIFWIGLYPQPLFDLLASASQDIAQRVHLKRQ